MSERPGRSSSVIGPAGQPLTVENLPPRNTVRWVIRRKAEVVAAVRNGLIGLDEACERYWLSAEEFLNWERSIAAHGLRGLIAAFLIGFAPPAWADMESGWQAYLAGDHMGAVAEIKPFAEAGVAQAQFYMGTLSEHGAGVPNDYRAAVDWFARAAGQGHRGAQFALGLLYYNGAGNGAISRDPVQAATWLSAAAEAGNAMAQHLVGRMYRLGQGVARNEALAVKWSLGAAQRGVVGAQFEMGVLISSRPHDRAERVAAYAWFLLAERAGHPGARQNLDLLAPRMHKVDIEQAVGIAEAWVPADDRVADRERNRQPGGEQVLAVVRSVEQGLAAPMAPAKGLVLLIQREFEAAGRPGRVFGVAADFAGGGGVAEDGACGTGALSPVWRHAA